MALDDDVPAAAGVSRRAVLKWMAAGGAVLVGEQLIDAPLGPFSRTGLFKPPPPAPYAPPASILVTRAADGLFATLSFVNLEVRPQRSGPPLLAVKDTTQDGYVAVGLPPQSLFEEAVYDDGGAPAPTPPTPPVGALLSGPSRLVLTVPRADPPLAYTAGSLLALAGFPLAIGPIARDGTRTGAAPGPADAPTALQTAIEAPYRLVLSPTAGVRFRTARSPVTRNGRTELWHARAVADASPTAPVPVRAIWSPDLVPATRLTAPGWAVADSTATITPDQRIGIVTATTATTAPPTAREAGGAEPAQADLLLVSPQGASLDITGAWPHRDGVIGWRHRSYLARDDYVKVEEAGYLFPFGFRAVRVSVSERVLGGGLAFLRKRIYIVVREPTVRYVPGDAASPGLPDGGRRFPFVRATTTTLVSPPIANPDGPDDVGAGRFVKVVGDGGAVVPLRYRLELESHDGHVAHTDLPLVFLLAADAYSDGGMDAVVADYAAADAASLRTLPLGGQRVGFVPRPPTGEDPALPTYSLVVGAIEASASTAQVTAAKRLKAYPTMVDAAVHIEALDALAPGAPGLAAAADVGTTSLQLYDDYVAGGFGGPNSGEVWAALPAPPNLSVPQQTGGGMAAPAFDVQGLSLAHGPVADPAKIAEGVFDPSAYFDDSLTLLGAIPLTAVVEMLPALPSPRGPAGENVPKVITNRSATEITTLVTWRPTLKETPLGLFTFKPAETEPDNRLDLKATFRTDLATGASSTHVEGDLRGATLDFFEAIVQPVDRVHFESRDGSKPKLDLELGTPGFRGDLQFLGKLQEYLPSLPGGVKVDISPRGVTAGLTIALPSVPLGAVLVQNLSIGVEISLPFDGAQATLTFSFCSREHPFHVTVMAIGGGGFLAIGMGMRGIQKIEGSIEFGAAIALNFGVASGSVSIMAGIYIKYEQRLDPQGLPVQPGGNTVVITGYVRANGELTVLSLIHVTVEFYLGLSFTKIDGEGTVFGEATLSVRVEVLFFSAEVSVTMRKEFGSGVDPSFGDQISARDWSDYCAAFAA